MGRKFEGERGSQSMIVFWTRGRYLEQNSAPEVAHPDLSWAVKLMKYFLNLSKTS
jgi:hypothetical protein